MVESIARITLDVQDLSTSVTVSAKHGDTGRKIVIALSDGGFLYEVGPDCYAVLTAEKPDGSILFNHCDIEGNCIVYAFTEQTTAVVGVFPCEVKLYGADDALITAARFRMIVDGTIYRDNLVESKDEVSALTHLLSEATEVINTGNKLNEQGQLAIQEVQTATQEAILATEQAEQASTDADESAESARAAAREAELATERTNQAIQETQTATQEAINSASAANSAADRAQGALVTVEQAAKTAAEMAEEAEQAVKDAEIAIEGAEKATTAANAAADRANAASVVAYQANEKVDTLREVVSKLHSNIVETASGEVITVSDSAEVPLQSLKLYGKTTQNGTPTPDAPVALESVGDSGSVTTTVCGKNLLNNTVTEWTSHGITYTKNADGSVSYSGTSSDGGHAYYYGMGTMSYENSTLFKAGTYIYSLGNSNFNTLIRVVNEDNTFSAIGTGAAISTFTLVEDCKIWVTCHLNNAVQGQSYSGTIYPMIRLASITDATYEPYKGTTSTVTPVDTSGNALYLPGIPVTSGGNYKDANEQEWICDEVDFEKGVYVQRVGIKIFNGTETFAMRTSGVGNNYLSYYGSDIKPAKANNVLIGAMCSHLQEKTTDYLWAKEDIGFSLISDFNEFRFRLPGVSSVSEVQALISAWKNGGNPLIVVYELAEENRIPLSEAELAQYTSMQSHYPNTTVFNDAGAHIELKYVADTKKYVDNKFAELAAALVSST